MQVLFAFSMSAIYVWGFYNFLHMLFRDSNGCMYSLASWWCTEPLK